MSKEGKILVIDDDIVQCGIIEKVAEKCALRATSVACYDDAASLLQAEAFDLIAVDLSLGNHNGIGLLTKAALLGRCPA